MVTLLADVRAHPRRHRLELLLEQSRVHVQGDRGGCAVVLLHRPDAVDNESSRAGEIDFIIAKQRNGGTGTVTLAHQMHYSRIVDMAA
ncbi:DnaB-like helicase C-terminal domain-containing protein [Flavimobilis rhizosphaerae]|uniref:DnaB-like helicase C-terminal domain-containing protein n=1 Tax=Flavimobilis rhizosphaerae TaxID=2775421 RepID=UPI0038B3B5FF